MTALDVFTYADQQVRTVIVDGEGWFVAVDVARILGYRMASDMTRRLDPDEKGTHSVRTHGGTQDVTIINEPGLYAAIFGSQLSEARDFKRWVNHDVLPQIHRTGKYAGVEQIEFQIPQTYAAALELAALQAKEIESKDAEIAAAAPKLEAFDRLMDSDGNYTFEAVAKMIGMGRNTLFRQLREAGILQSGSRLPYQRYAHHFDVVATTWRDREGNEHPSFTTKILPSGLPFILKKIGATLPASLRAVSS